MKKAKDQINEYIKKNVSSKTDQEILLALTKKGLRGSKGQQLTLGAIQSRRRRLSLPVFIPQEELTIPQEIERETIKEQNRTLNLNKKKYLKHIQDLEQKVEKYEEVTKAMKDYNPKVLPIRQIGGIESVGMLLISDTHPAERVLRHEVNGLNEYNPEVAERRIQNIFINGRKIFRMSCDSYNADTIVVALLGDMITGTIHDSLRETNTMGYSEEVPFITKLIVDGINYLSEDKKIKKILVRCHVGNHGRITEDYRYGKNERDNNSEHIVYTFVKQLTASNSKVTVEIPMSQMSYMDILGTKVRFMHGHGQFSFREGVGGITIPLNKKIPKLNEGVYADLTVMGHFHRFLDGDKFVINGTTMGTTPYSLKFGHTDPTQTFFYISARDGQPKGKSLVTPIWLD